MTIPFGSLITQAANARTAYSGGKAAAQQQGQKDQLSQALMLIKLQQDQQKDALAQALNQAQIGHLNAQTKQAESASEGQWGPAFPGTDEGGQPVMVQQHKMSGELRLARIGGGKPQAPAVTEPKAPAPPMPGDSQDMTGGMEAPGQAPAQAPTNRLSQALGGQIRPPLPKPTAQRPASMIPGTPEWKAAKIAEAEIAKEHGYHAPPTAPTNVYLPSVDPVTGATVYSVGQSKGDPNITATKVQKPSTSGGLASGSQTSVADMEQRLAEVSQHARRLALGKGEVTRPMQMREGLEYGIANQSAGGHGVPVKSALTAGGMDLFGLGGGPGDKTYDEYAALMNSQRALGDDVAKVFKGRQNEEAVKREIALASLNPGDYKNPQVVRQKLSRLQNIIDLAKVTQPKTGSAAAQPGGNPDNTLGNINLGGGHVTPEERAALKAQGFTDKQIDGIKP